ncbi:MAG: succinate dehydrogenase, cytochrome b556 subunit [Burkholderiales bacterium]
MTPASARARPKHLNLSQIRLPLPGIISIMHRISGAALFLALPFLLCLLQQSLEAPDTYVRFRGTLEHPLVKLILIGLLWGFLHHFFAGIRYLLLDMHVGTDLPRARSSSTVVLVVSIALTLVLGVWLW